MSTKNQTYDAIVIGSGISGGWAAKELCEKGLKRSKQFSWNNMAKAYLKQYELIHSAHSKK